MKTLQISLALAACCGSLLAGCDDGKSIQDFQVTARPVPLEGALLYAHDKGDHADALIVDVTGSKPSISAHELPPGGVKTQTRPGSDGTQVVVLTQGTPVGSAKSGRDAKGSAVLVFDHTGEVFSKELEGRFTDLTLSPDGRIAIAHGHGEGTGVDVGNTVAIVDLQDGTVRNVALSDNAGRPAESFAFPEASDGSRRLMAARGVDTLSLLELDHLDRRPKEIQVKLSNDPRTLRPGKIIFRANEIFVQLEGSSDVLVLQLVDVGGDAFRVTPLYLTTGSGVEDMELVNEAGPERRLVVLGQQSVSVVDPITGNVTTSNTDHPFVDLVPYNGPSPVDEQIRERGLLLPGENGSTIAFVDFADASSWSNDNVETLILPDSLERVIPLSQHRMVVLGYRGGGMGLVDLDSRKVTPINTGSTVTSALVDEAAGQARLWLSLANQNVARVDLLRLETREIELADSTDELVLIEGTPRQVAALHNAVGGHITLLDPENPTLSSVREMVSFFYTDILD